MTTDEDLMAACGRGSMAAFDELFGRYRQIVWAFFRRRLLDRARAEDLAQDVFVAVLKSARRYEPRAPFRAYLFGIAFHVLAADRRRAVGHTPELVHDGSAAPLNSTDEVLWVRQAIGRLEDSDREVLMLREFEQLSYAEIAGVLSVPVNTVRSRLFRARVALRARLAPSQES